MREARAALSLNRPDSTRPGDLSLSKESQWLT